MRLHVQQLSPLPGIGTAALPLTAGMQHILRYPRPTAVALAADSATMLYSGSSCAHVPCGPVVVAAALTIVDDAADPATALLPNVALSAWLRDMMDPASDDRNATAWAQALLQLEEAVGTSADLAHGGGASWLRVIAAPAESGSVRGHWNRDECLGQGVDVVACGCSVEVPALFSQDLYGITQVPVVMLEIPLRAGTPPEVGTRILERFNSMFAESRTHRRLCVATAAEIDTPAGGCTSDGPVPEVTLPEPPQPCEDKWIMDVYKRRCSTAQVPGVLVPMRPEGQGGSVHTSRVDVIDVLQESCSQLFPGVPAAVRSACAAWSAHLCLDEAQLLRVNVMARGGAEIPASLAVNGTVKAFVQDKHFDQPDSTDTVGMIPAADVRLALAPGCHHLEVVFDLDAANEVACVRACSLTPSICCL